MRILYIDIDTLRADHLGCYGYHRDTSPNIDELARQGVRFEDYVCLRTYYDGYKMLEPVMLFNLADDPHEQIDMADERPDLVARVMAFLTDWYQEMATTALHDVDPMMIVLREGGSFHTRGRLPAYLERLRATGRAYHAEALAARHPDEL